MNAVERIIEYESLPQESPDIIEDHRPPQGWPAQGQIKFVDYDLKYRKGDLVLKKINATIDGMQKVGIVGRTGAGKTR